MTQICYYGDKLSTNMAMTPEGFLICKNVPIARTGYQQYLESELIEDGDPNELVNVYRSPNEVFSTATLASFEGKPVTNGHPDVDVTPDNYQKFSKGHVQHVRIGRGDDSDKILADLYITDPDLIDDIRNNGKREVSAGYYAEDAEDSSGRICQTKIRGNHVAVVDEGRAGHSVAIRDAQNNPYGGVFMKRKVRTTDRKRVIADAIVKYLQDAKQDELEERLADVQEVLNDEAPEEEPKADACKDEEPEDLKKDEDLEIWKAIDAISERLDAIEQNMHHDEEPKEDEDVEVAGDDDEVVEDENVEVSGDDDDIIEDEDADGDGEDDVEIIETEDEEPKLSAKDAAIKAISKAALAIRNPEDRKRVQDAIRCATKSGKSQMSGLMNLVKSNKAKRDNSASKNIDVEALQKIYDALNPHNADK